MTMNRSLAQVQAIANTLPIGFYAKRRIETEMSETEPTSYYSIMEDKIVISYPIIAQGLSRLEDGDEDFVETSIRSMLYHEVSHAILTPRTMRCTDIMNIFEDERIETLLNNYYHNVDFKRNLILVNGLNDHKAKNAMDAFYQLVRYRRGPEKLVRQVSEIIRKFSKLNATNGNTYMNESYNYSFSIAGYERDVYNLYNDLARMMGEDQKRAWEDEPSKKMFTPGEGEGGGERMMSGLELSSEELEEALEQINDASGELPGLPSGEEIAASVINYNYDASLTDAICTIIANFNKKNTGGSAINAYSGHLDYRSVARDDYRYFLRKTSVNGNNTFGTFNLNLFIDDSGSMAWNERAVNKLLYALSYAARINANFTYNIITCADHIGLRPKNYIYKAVGGTYLSRAIIPIYKEVQKNNTFNYNIILFDGQASVDPYFPRYGAGAAAAKGNKTLNTFQTFNNSSCTIISDPSNERNLAKVKNAKVIFSTHYAEELADNVIKTLATAFR